MLYVRRLYMRLRLWWVERQLTKSNSWEANLITMLRICAVVDRKLLAVYTPQKGVSIGLITGITNAQQAIDFLRRSIELVSKGDYIPDNIAGTPYQRRAINLDEFLVDSKQRSIGPMEFHDEVCTLLLELKTRLDKMDGDTMPRYYRRKFGGFLTDLFAVQEALLKVALV